MANVTNKARTLTRDDYFQIKANAGFANVDALTYASVVAHNRVACQNEVIGEELAKLNENLAGLNDNLRFIRGVVEENWLVLHEKGWFAELMRKIAER